MRAAELGVHMHDQHRLELLLVPLRLLQLLKEHAHSKQRAVLEARLAELRGGGLVPGGQRDRGELRAGGRGERRNEGGKRRRNERGERKEDGGQTEDRGQRREER